MKIYYDAEVDALYIELRSVKAGEAECRDLNEDITANYGTDGKIVGLEILDASKILGEELNRFSVEVAPMRLKVA